MSTTAAATIKAKTTSQEAVTTGTKVPNATKKPATTSGTKPAQATADHSTPASTKDGSKVSISTSTDYTTTESQKYVGRLFFD